MSEQTIKVIAIFGESCCGKDTLVKELLQLCPDQLCQIVHTTSRSPRHGEQEGVDYHYISKESFTNKFLNGDFISAHCYGNGTWYGTDIKDLSKDKINIGAFSAIQLKDWIADDRFEILPIYLYVPPKQRLRRALNRDSDCHEICRRFLADEIDYAEIPFGYYQFHQNDIYEVSTIGGLINFIDGKDFSNLKYNKYLRANGLWAEPI